MRAIHTRHFINRMIAFQDWLIFAVAALGMVLSTEPTMIYLISRSICQSRRAGVISLIGAILGFCFLIFGAFADRLALFDRR